MGPLGSGGGEQLTAKDMWDEIKNHGFFHDGTDGASPRLGSSIGTAAAATTTVPAGGTREVSFGVSWSCPEVKFHSGRIYHRWYTKFLGLERDAVEERLAQISYE